MLVPHKYSSLDITKINPTVMNNGANYYLLVPSTYWYRVFKLPTMKVLLDSVVFDGKIRAIA